MPYPTIHLADEYRAIGADRSLRRLAESGQLLRIATGTYVDRAAWTAMDSDHRYRTRVQAAAAVRPAEQISHDSAAAIWRLPSLTPWPHRVHLLAVTDTGGRSRAGLARHCTGLDPAAEFVDGVLVTSLARTVVDIARGVSYGRAVVMIDHALRWPRAHEFRFGIPPVTEEQLLAVLETGSPRGASRARRAIRFGDAGSQSAAESLSRVQLQALGLPKPQLQREFRDAKGSIYPDFYFEEWDLACEVDGKGKYGQRRAYQRNLSPELILDAEKDRGDRLRRLVTGVVRWGFAEASDRRALAARLRAHGVRV
ncbi:MAG: hypothetical protein JWO10_1235 [Microbacteriaceae bacterium]|nr:hypothetical protein [Microbacteriaceae bacterium]